MTLEEEGTTVLRNVGNHSTNDTVSSLCHWLSCLRRFVSESSNALILNRQAVYKECFLVLDPWGRRHYSPPKRWQPLNQWHNVLTVRRQVAVTSRSLALQTISDQAVRCVAPLTVPSPSPLRAATDITVHSDSGRADGHWPAQCKATRGFPQNPS